MAADHAIVLIHGAQVFNFITGYYQMFPQEVSIIGDADNSGYTFLSVEVPKKSGRVSTFQGLVDAMIAHAKAGTKNFVLVCHGLSDKTTDVPNALGLELAPGTQLKATDYFFKLMEDWRLKDLSKEAAAKVEGLEHFNVGKNKVHAPPGVLSRIHAGLTELRKLELHRVEIRACHLGANNDMLRNIGRVLGTDFITAPDVHMFYGGPISLHPPFDRPRTDKEFDQFTRKHPRARVFTNSESRPSADVGERFGLDIVGKGPTRTMFAASTSSNLKWFVNKFIMLGNHYPLSFLHLTRPAPPFVVAGMDLLASEGGSYALPLERGYSRHLVLQVPGSN